MGAGAAERDSETVCERSQLTAPLAHPGRGLPKGVAAAGPHLDL